ncbi:AAA-domain-containing protein [Phellopilus nigrolimitatus]|nr:AAA-domain-containing protein [Phellopilus nigrolimitatus]
MRSLLQPTRSLLRRRSTSKAQCVLFSYSQAARYPRRESTPTRAASRTHKRASSSSTPSAPLPPSAGFEQSATANGSTPPEEPEDGRENGPDKPLDGEKSKRPRKPKVAESESDALLPLPPGLDILWTPDIMDPASPSALPPPELFQEVLTDLLITLHPQSQHRGTYPSPTGPPVEPTLALYCPFEGGDYIIDETVRELARRTDSDVVVLDAVQLAAGEWGSFGKAATALQLPQNPLHFRAPATRASPSNRVAAEEDFEDDEDDYASNAMPSHMTVHVMPPANLGRPGRQGVLTPASRGLPSSKTKAFFDELINVSSARDAEAVLQGKRRSRLIYIRDYPTLSASASSWYPALLASVRQRRQGPMPRPTSSAANNITIVFGMTPPIVQPSSPPPHGGQSVLGLMNARQHSPAVLSSPARPGKHDYSEGEHAEKAREKRLRDRLRKWERDEQAFYDEMPRLPQSSEGNNGFNERPGVVVLGDSGLAGSQSGIPSALFSALQNRVLGRGDESPDNSQFFRTSVLVPSLRNLALERSCRVSRRREINELTTRMGVGAVGGKLEGELMMSEPPSEAEPAKHSDEISSRADPEPSDLSKMWDEWGKQIEAWTNVKDIADRAVGSVVATDIASLKSLDPTPIPWTAIVSAWTRRSSVREVRKTWLQDSSGKLTKDQPEEPSEETEPKQDEVLQRVKEDPELTTHEQRLLGCIVDATSMPTSFSQVHLSPHTIDSVRTIVSLPLLHPSAFQSGILKQHSMTGCLLFGPPGTGKTLVVRALAKEAGCRMLAVQPSDVMDMYVGEGEKLVRSVFSLARRLSPCVIFLDEIDALFGARSSARETGGALAHHGVITEFMQEMDGLKTNRNSNVIVIGATNRPFDLDDAVLRRLPRRLLVDLPGMNEREEILKILLRDEAVANDVDLAWLAQRTELFSGSDLKHLCVSAALDAVKEGITLPWTVPKAESPEAKTVSSESPANTLPTDAPAEEVLVAEATPIASEKIQDDAVKEQSPSLEEASAPRVLYLRHFTKALKEITPSSSESLGSLSALRKWNEEFGEGQKKKRKIMWGKGSFGFTDPNSEKVLDGRVAEP